MKKNVVIMTAMCAMAAQAEVSIDSEIPAGNIVFERMEGDGIFLHQERRGSPGWWFYWDWAFRARGAEGRTLAFIFTDGEPVGARGAAVSADKGLTWAWQNRDFTKNKLTYTFGPAESEVSADSAHQFGVNLATALRQYLPTSGGNSRSPKIQTTDPTSAIA